MYVYISIENSIYFLINALSVLKINIKILIKEKVENSFKNILVTKIVLPRAIKKVAWGSHAARRPCV